MKAALIVNPYASRVTERRLWSVEQELGRSADVTVLTTAGRGHAVELAAEAARRADAIVVFAGDGGFNEVVNGVDVSVPLGFVPGGGKNVLPRALGLPPEPAAAARRIAEALRHGRTRRISVGRVNRRRFTFSAGLGVDAELVRRVDARGRSQDGRRPGDLAFVAEAAKLVLARRGRFEPALEIAGYGPAAFALVSNGDPYTYVGPLPFRVAPEARFELGLDLRAPVRLEAASIPRALWHVFRGQDQWRVGGVHYGHDLDRIEVVCGAPMPLQADGEDLGDVERAEFVAEREAVSVLV